MSSRPRLEDRTDTLSIKEHVFRDADDSVLSIVPSRQSSRISLRTLTMNGEEASIKSRASSRIGYSRLSFENHLFTSFVYKRNYQFPHRNLRYRSPNLIPKSALPIAEFHTDIDAPERSLTEQPAPEELNKSLHTVVFSPILTFQDDTDIIMDNMGLSQTQELAKSVNRAEFLQACRYLSYGVDFVFLFHGPVKVDSAALITFLQHLLEIDIQLFATAMQRLAYTAGTPFMRRITDPDLYNNSGLNEIAWVWKAIHDAAAVADAVDSLIPGDRRFSVLQLACAGGNHAVASYLLRAGFSGGPYEKALSRLKKDHQMEKLLGSLSLSDGDIFTEALWQVLADAYSGSIVWWAANGTPLIWTVDAAIELFVRHGADISGHGTYMQRTHAPLFDVFHAISNGDVDPKSGLQLFEALLHNGAHPDALGVWILKDTGQGVTISPLTLAVVLGAEQLVGALLRCGAKVFGSGSVDFLKKSASTSDKLALKRIHDTIAAVNNDESASTLEAAEILREMVNQIDPDIRHSACTLPRQYRQSQHIIRQTSSTASSLDQANIEVAHDAITGAVTIPHEHVSRLLDNETEANTCLESAKLWFFDFNDNGFSGVIERLRKGWDLGLALNNFQRTPLIWVLDCILRLWIIDKDFATVVCKRLAFATDDAWTRGLKSFLLQRRSDIICSTGQQRWLTKQELQELRLPVLWRDVEQAAMFADKWRSYSYRVDLRAASLYFAVAANDCRVTEYILSTGLRPFSGSFELLHNATYNHAVSMTELLVSHIEFSSETYTDVLERLIDNMLDDHHLSPPQTLIDIKRTPNPEAAVEILRILLDRGAEVARIMTMRTDLLHCICTSSLDEDLQLKALKLLIQHGADVNAVAGIESTRLTFLWPSVSRTPGFCVLISTLALAAVQGLETIVPFLLDEGARTLWCNIPSKNGRGLYLVKGHDPERQRSAMQNIFSILLSYRSELHDVHDLLHIYENAVWFMGREQIFEQHVKYYICLPDDANGPNGQA
jgi:hypothetical protein